MISLTNPTRLCRPITSMHFNMMFLILDLHFFNINSDIFGINIMKQGTQEAVGGSRRQSEADEPPMRPTVARIVCCEIQYRPRLNKTDAASVCRQWWGVIWGVVCYRDCHTVFATCLSTTHADRQSVNRVHSDSVALGGPFVVQSLALCITWWQQLLPSVGQSTQWRHKPDADTEHLLHAADRTSRACNGILDTISSSASQCRTNGI